MNIIILGAGRQGLAAGTLIKKFNNSVTVADSNNDNLIRAGKQGFNTLEIQIDKQNDITDIINGYDLAVGALPAHMGTMAHRAAIEAGINMVDVSYCSDNPLELNEEAMKKNVLIIPDAGVAPGLSNLLTGCLYNYFDTTEYLGIFVGGMPEKYFPPIGYSVTWSPNDLIDEYLRPARIIEHNDIVTYEALSHIEDFHFKGIENLESFYSDGLRTLLFTLPDVHTMIEKTVRYSGHAEQMKLLRDMGFFEDSCGEYSPRSVSACLLSLIKTDLKDILIMRIEGNGLINGKKCKRHFDIYDKADNEFSAMERTTGFSLAAFTLLLSEGILNKTGVMPPELIAQDGKCTDFVLKLLMEQNISITDVL